MGEAEDLLRKMPSKSLKDRRAPAIFALAFLGGLRADTLVSLRVNHIDVVARRIDQNGKVARTKNGKSIEIAWFPIPALFGNVVSDWIETLDRLGIKGDDALFPDLKWLKRSGSVNSKLCRPIPVVRTTSAIDDAFAIASQGSEQRYTPHASKHTLGAEKNLRPLTALERKAWSISLGHENEQTTEMHYGKLSDVQRLEIMDNIGTSRPKSPRDLPEADQLKMFHELLEKFGM